MIAGGVVVVVVVMGALALSVAVWWSATRLRIATVTGSSMMPTLRDNDRVLVRRTRRVRRGDIVLATAATRTGTGFIVKRVAALAGDPGLDGLDGPRVPAGMLMLLGDNAQASADSRDFGYVPAERLFGIIVRKM